ncbi:tetratricopeptide repeat protein [Aquimarina agarilytica]|uniref:tetratricopeptide repeat protein n=1 Tax=Aquimarina agarilytica TaxID=1087449 RepID=UPI0002887320|nr:tetratricopeptide repeat protein [Aquimarina agarilytica]
MYLSHHDNNDNVALDKYEAMLKSNRVIFFDSNEFENIIHFYLDNGKLTNAKKAIALGLTQHPSSTNLKLLNVEIMVFEDELDNAERLLNQLQALEPENDEIFIQRASIVSKRNNHEKAIELLQTALKITQDKADVHSLLGMEYLFMDEFENAKNQFIACLKIDPDDYSSLYNSINCFNFLEQPEEAINFLTTYLDTNPYCEIAWHQLGKQYCDIKELKKALAAFDFAIISDDTFVGAYIEKGKVLEKLGRYNDAIENYSITLELEDPTSFALLHIGKSFEKLGDQTNALHYYKKTVNEDPLLDKGWIAITDFYNAKKDYQKALYYINKAIEIDFENIDYWKRYAKINLRLGYLEEAERGYRKSLEFGDYEINTWIQRTDLLLQLGEIDATIVCVNQALELFPDNNELFIRLAGLYYKKQDLNKANFYLETALKSDAEYFVIFEELFPEYLNSADVQHIYTGCI